MSNQDTTRYADASINWPRYKDVRHRLRQANGLLWELLKLEILVVLVLVLGAAATGAIVGGWDIITAFW